MKIQLKTDGIFKQSNFKLFIKKTRQEIFQKTADIMKDEAKRINELIIKETSSKLKIRKQVVLKSFKGKVYFKNKNIAPAMHFYSGVPWMGAHTEGASISKNTVIPFSLKPIGRKTLRNILDSLARLKNLHFDKNGKTTIIWSVNNKESQSLLRNFKAFSRNLKKSNNQKSTIRKDERVNVGVLVKGTNLRKKINMSNIVEANLDRIVKRIEKEL